LAEDNVAVLIDYENTGLDSVQYLLDQLSDVGRVIIRRAYADWSIERGKRDQLLELGIEARHLFRSTRSGKNSSDILLTMDAIELLYGADLDTFVIVSSDSDFVPLVSKLRGAGKIVIGAGRRDVTSATLIKSCDRYIFFPEAQTPKRAPSRTRQQSPESPSPSPSRSVGSPLVRALEVSMDEQGQVVGSKLYQTMLRIDPSFNFKTLGHRTFTHYLESSQEIRVERPPGRGDVVVQLNQPRDADVRAVGPTEADSRAPVLPVSREPESSASNGSLSPDWERDVDSAWSKRNRNGRLSGQAAAVAAAQALNQSSLKTAGYRSLDKLLDGSPFLRTKWRRDGNAILRL
jgi:uncharacterized protein (TIGR00288 family)